MIEQGWCPRCQAITPQRKEEVGDIVQTFCLKCNTLLSKEGKRKSPRDKMKKGDKIKCPYCGTEFEHNGKIELQKCPGCGSELLC